MFMLGLRRMASSTKSAPDGKGGKFFTAQEKYVTALAASPGRIYIATGGGTGRVYKIETQRFSISGQVIPVLPTQPLFTSPEAHILSLATDKSGNVYAGSSPDGIVYKITPDGKSSVLYDATEPNISALATDSQGNVYVGTQPQGNIYKIAPDGRAKLLPTKATSGIMALRTDAERQPLRLRGQHHL